jgi:phage terminase large subunit-like protein
MAHHASNANIFLATDAADYTGGSPLKGWLTMQAMNNQKTRAAAAFAAVRNLGADAAKTNGISLVGHSLRSDPPFKLNSGGCC